MPLAPTLAIVLLFTGCAGGPARITEVSHQKKLVTVGEADEEMFLQDRASHIQVKARPLPRDQQGEEFYVRWAGDNVRTVRLEYRQVNQPGQVQLVSHQPDRNRATAFQIRGDTWHQGGPVSAWRVTLLQADDQVVAEAHSALW